MKTASPESRARTLVRVARGRAVRHALARALARGVAVAALLALVLGAGARLAGAGRDAWLVLAVLPGAAVATHGFRRIRSDDVRCAVLLDGAAGSKERFTAVVTARDEEVRDLAARQALASEKFRDGAFPLEFPPTSEGLVAVFSIVALAAFLLLVPASGPAPARAGGSGVSPLASAGAPSVGGEPRDPGAVPARPEAAVAEAVVARIAGGSELTDEEWESLGPEAVTPEERAAIESAIAAGDPAAAAAALRAALAGPAPGEGATGTPPAESGEAWSAYAESLARPVWSPEYDEIVRRYYAEAGRRGLR